MLANVGIPEFKTIVGATTLEVLKNPKTDKLFLSASNGKNYKVQGDINLKEELVMLIEDGKFDDACLINKGRGLKALATL